MAEKVKKLKASKNVRLNRSRGGDVIIAVILLLFGVFMVLPMGYAISSSLKPYNEIFAFPPRFFVQNPTLKNFSDLFDSMSESWIPFGRYFFNTLVVAVAGTTGHIILSSIAAYSLAKHRFRGQKVIFQIIIMSLMFTSTVTTIPSFYILSKLGLVNTFWVLILPAFSSPLGLYLMKQFIEQMVLDTVLEAARIDGSSEIRIFFKIVMPMVKPAWLTLIVFSFQSLWATSTTPLIQREELKPLNYALQQILTTGTGVSKTGVASAGTVLMMVLPIIVFLITQSNVIETMSSSGMKD